MVFICNSSSCKDDDKVRNDVDEFDDVIVYCVYRNVVIMLYLLSFLFVFFFRTTVVVGGKLYQVGKLHTQSTDLHVYSYSYSYIMYHKVKTIIEQAQQNFSGLAFCFYSCFIRVFVLEEGS